MNDCARVKEPGPDGFSFSFIKAGWEFLRQDFCDMLLEFHRRGQLHEEINATFLPLDPKVLNPVDLKDFRPISLVGCVHKLLVKILANRLKVVLHQIISPFQGAFINSRQIVDGILTANELIHSRKQSHKEGVIFKIDLEKAYKHVNWRFVDYMMGRFGFGEKWRMWIKECFFYLFCPSEWLSFSFV